MTHERKNLGIKGSIKIPDSNYFLVPGSLWNEWKTIIHSDPESDEEELEVLKDAKGNLIVDEKGDIQEVFRRRSLSNPKDVNYFKDNDITVYKSFEDLQKSGGRAFDLYLDKSDGKIYDPSSDTWMENFRHEAVREVGGIFVNDTYMHLWKKDQGLLFLDGSYGSGKTTWAITHLLRLCLDSPKGKFNCFYGRQQKEMATQLHKNIIEEIKRNHWESKFTYSEKDNGSKNIHCTVNGGLFQLFGCDDDATIKGWNNPTHILVDEINQITFDSFGMLQSRLRRPGVKTLMIGCFNACDVIPIDSDDNGSWLWRYIFKEGNDGTKEDIIKRKVFKSMGITKHHSDYLDNYTQNNYKYWFNLYIQAKLDPIVAARFANGDWGTKIGAQLYYHRFNYDKHVRPTLPYYEGKKIINGWDENTQPYQPTLLVQKIGNTYHFLKEYLGYNPNNNVHGVAPMIIEDWGIKGKNHKGGWDINGDATSKKEDSKLEKGTNYFTIIQNLLRCFKPEIRVQDANPNNKTRGDFLNLILHQEAFGIIILISEEGCPKLIEDLRNVMQDVKNEKKSGHKDKSTKIVNGVRQVQPFGHLADIMDYIVCENSMSEYLTFQNGDMTIDAVGGRRSVRNSWEKDREGKPVIEESDQVKRNKKYRGDTKYGDVNSNPEEEDYEEEIEIENKKRKSKNSW